MNKLVWVAIGLAWTTACVAAAPIDPLNLMEERTFAAQDGTTLRYRLLAPKNAKVGRKYPIVLYLHGAGGRGIDNAEQINDAPDALCSLASEPTASRFPCYVIAPQCPPDRAWTSTGPNPTVGPRPPEFRALIELVDEVQKEFGCDPARRYVTGVSMGGVATYALLIDYPGYFAAAVPVCGAGDARQGETLAKTPFWAFHGGADPVVPVVASKAMVGAADKAGGEVRYTEYPGVGHNSWNKAYAEPQLWPWVFSHRADQPKRTRKPTEQLVDPLTVTQDREFRAPSGVTLNYRLLRPKNVVAGRKYPLVMYLHGIGGRGTDNAKQLVDEPLPLAELASEPMASRFPCYVIAPQCPPDVTWAPFFPGQPTPPEFYALPELVKSVEAEFGTDPARRYLTGLSMGGYGSWALLGAQPNFFAAAVPICGAGDVKRAREMAKTPIWAFHGACDPVVPVDASRSLVKAINEVGGHARYTEYPTAGHESWLRAYRDQQMWTWLFAQRLGETAGGRRGDRTSGPARRKTTWPPHEL